jgi:hypothetical protein
MSDKQARAPGALPMSGTTRARFRAVAWADIRPGDVLRATDGSGETVLVAEICRHRVTLITLECGASTYRIADLTAWVWCLR